MTSRLPNEIDATPRASSLIESLRSFGYSPATSIADLIDNSISAHASRVDVQFHWQGAASWMSLVDDGDGMRPRELNEAMRPGSANPLNDREADDLGRFGLGLKTASFSQARMLTVATRHADHPETEVRCWDLDYVQRTDRWVVLTDSPHASALESLLSRSGTVVAWHHLDRIVDDRPESDSRASNSFYAMVDDIRTHLEMVFHRFISDGLQISVNGATCEAWDPFMEKHASTERLQTETLTLMDAEGGERVIEIQPFVLPHNSKLDPAVHKRAGGPKGWNLQQGYYLYRRRRLIVAGDWFDRGTKPEEHHKLARIRVEFEQDLDANWALDVRKAKARPPSSLRADFARISSATRHRAEEVYRSRGRRSVGPAPRRGPKVPLWVADTSGANVRYLVNREHPAIRTLLSNRLEPDLAEDAVHLIEAGLPVAHILSQGFRDESLLQKAGEVDETTQASARRLFCAMRRTGASIEEARKAVAEAQPFDTAYEYIQTLTDRSCQ